MEGQSGREDSGRRAHPPLSLRGSRVLVTGAAGFIGANLVEGLIETGCQVVAIVRRSSDLRRIDHLIDRVELVEADVADMEPSALAARVGGVRIVFHLAATGVLKPDLESRAVVDTNAGGTLRMLQASYLLGADRFVYCGSCFEYGGGESCSEEALPAPLSQYGASKAGGWLLAQAFSRRYGTGVVGLRPFTVYGPGEAPTRLVSHVIGAILRDEPIELTAGRQRRDFVFVEDVVDGFMRAAVAPGVNRETFNLCTGHPTCVSEIVHATIELMGSDRKPVFGERALRAVDSAWLVGNPTRAAQRLGWMARTSLRDGLEHTIRWHEQQQLVFEVADIASAARP